jgi:hypothetical protein
MRPVPRVLVDLPVETVGRILGYLATAEPTATSASTDSPIASAPDPKRLPSIPLDPDVVAALKKVRDQPADHKGAAYTIMLGRDLAIGLRDWCNGMCLDVESFPPRVSPHDRQLLSDAADRIDAELNR